MGALLNRLGEIFWKMPVVSILVASLGIIGFGFLILSVWQRPRDGHRSGTRVAISVALLAGMLSVPLGMGAVAFASKAHCETIAGSQQYLDEQCWGAGGD